MHPWIGAGVDDRQRILKEIGKNSIDELFLTVPDEVCVDSLNLDNAKSEDEIMTKLAEMSLVNTRIDSKPSFLGGGVYNHIRPSIIDAVLSRAEFFTSYTPYQPEISQGTLQAIFEFQTLVCQLSGLDVANASMYDGATALVEAALLCFRVQKGKRNRIVVAETVHPMYRSVLETYTRALGIEVVCVPPASDGRISPESIVEAAADSSCCVAIQSPNFLGIIEDLGTLSEAAHNTGALAVQVVSEATSLGILKGGGSFGFDVVCGDAQAFGIPPGFGGPHLGFFACREKYVRQMPGRLVGETLDSNGQRAFCLTLSTREQHIRRAKATSNICSNHGLMALAAVVWLEALGGSGLDELARSCLSRAEELKRRILELGNGWRLAYPSSPTYNEFLVVGPKSGEELIKKMAEQGVLVGPSSQMWKGSWSDGFLVAVTELTSVSDTDALISGMGGLS